MLAKSIKHQEMLDNSPWLKSFYCLRQRCNNPNNTKFYLYGGKGIRALLTVTEIKELWFRDKAYEMNKPTIDRIKSDKDYTFDNCRFIEHKENSIRGHKKPIFQYDLKGNFIKEWESAVDAAKELKVLADPITACARKVNRLSYGYIWRYKC